MLGDGKGLGLTGRGSEVGASGGEWGMDRKGNAIRIKGNMILVYIEEKCGIISPLIFIFVRILF